MASDMGQETQTALSWASQPPGALGGSSLVLSITAGRPMDLLLLPAGILPRCARGHWGYSHRITEDQSPTPESFCKKGLKTACGTPETEPGRYPSPNFLVLTQPRGSPSPAGSTPCPCAVGLVLPHRRMLRDGEPAAPGAHCSSSASLQGTRAAPGGRCPRCSMQAGTRPYCELKKGEKSSSNGCSAAAGLREHLTASTHHLGALSCSNTLLPPQPLARSQGWRSHPAAAAEFPNAGGSAGSEPPRSGSSRVTALLEPSKRKGGCTLGAPS